MTWLDLPKINVDYIDELFFFKLIQRACGRSPEMLGEFCFVKLIFEN